MPTMGYCGLDDKVFMLRQQANEHSGPGLQSVSTQGGQNVGTSVGFGKHFTRKLKWPLFSWVNFFFFSYLFVGDCFSTVYKHD